MEKPKLLIFTAVQTESRAVAKALSGALRPFDGVGTLWCGTPDADLYQIGISAARLRDQALLNSISRTRVKAVIMAGLAGALDPDLRAGEVVAEPSPVGAWPRLPWKTGLIHTVDRLIATVAQKSAIYQQTGALAVDMEGRIVREFAGQLGVPFLSLRVISDIAHESIDPSVVGFVDEFGRLRPGKVAATLLRRPWTIWPLLRLERNVRRAADSLTDAIRWVADRDLPCMAHPATRLV